MAHSSFVVNLFLLFRKLKFNSDCPTELLILGSEQCKSLFGGYVWSHYRKWYFMAILFALSLGGISAACMKIRRYISYTVNVQWVNLMSDTVYYFGRWFVPHQNVILCDTVVHTFCCLYVYWERLFVRIIGGMLNSSCQ